MKITDPDLDAIEARANLATGGPWFASVDEAIAADAHRAVLFHGYEPEDAEFVAHAREDVPALVAYARTLEAELEVAAREARAGARLVVRANRRAEAAEVERDQLRDTLELRSAAHNRLAQRLDQIRALVNDHTPVFGAPVTIPTTTLGDFVRDIRRVLDGDQRTETP